MSQESLREQAEGITSLLGRLMSRLFTLDPEDPSMELPIAQVRVCALLRKGPKPMSVLGKELAISLSATTQLADRLERGGLVERVPEPEDRRVKSLRLTPRGVELMRRRRERRVGRVYGALEVMPAEDRQRVFEAITLLLRAAQATAPEVPEDGPVAGQLVE